MQSVAQPPKDPYGTIHGAHPADEAGKSASIAQHVSLLIVALQLLQPVEISSSQQVRNQGRKETWKVIPE